MKLRLVGPACRRVQAALDDALTTGELHLPPELVAHVEQCPGCAASVEHVRALLHRLRSAAAGLPMALLPGTVDRVLETTAGIVPARVGVRPTWFLGQVAALAGILVVLVGLLVGLMGLVIYLLGTAFQSAWQPAAQALLSSPGVSLLFEREMHVLLYRDCVKYLWLLVPWGARGVNPAYLDEESSAGTATGRALVLVGLA